MYRRQIISPIRWLCLIFVCSSLVAYASSGPQDSSAGTQAANTTAKPKMMVRILRPSAPGLASTSLDRFAGLHQGTPSNVLRTATQPSVSGGGSGIVYTCDPSIDAANAGTCNYLNTTIAGLYSSTFSNANANIYITYGNTGLGESDGFNNFVTYTQYLTALTNENGPGTVRADAVASLPATEPALYAGAQVEVTSALYQALGFGTPAGIDSSGNYCASPGSAGCYDAVIKLATPTIVAGYGQGYWYRTGTQGANDYDFYTIAEHETDEVLGTSSCVDTSGATLADGCGANEPSAVDLYRYNNNGGVHRVLIDTTSGAYFSYDSGASNGADGADYNTLSNGDDYADFVTSCQHVQDATGCAGMSFNITNDGGPEINILDAIGYNLRSSSTAGGNAHHKSEPGHRSRPDHLYSTFVSQNGSFTDLTWADVVINTNLAASGGCFVRYYQPTNSLYLENNGGTGAMGPAHSGLQQFVIEQPMYAERRRQQCFGFRRHADAHSLSDGDGLLHRHEKCVLAGPR